MHEKDPRNSLTNNSLNHYREKTQLNFHELAPINPPHHPCSSLSYYQHHLILYLHFVISSNSVSITRQPCRFGTMTWSCLRLYWSLLLIILIPRGWLRAWILGVKAWGVRVRFLGCSITWVALRGWSMGRRSWGCRL